LKSIESIEKEFNFQQLLLDILKKRSLSRQDISIVTIEKITLEEYRFVFVIIRTKEKFLIQGVYNSKARNIVIKRSEEVIENVVNVVVPQKNDFIIVPRDKIASNSDAKESIDYIYKVRPSFRQGII
jgi:hypothetical protein